ncbi:hypothetical protein BOX15_Mlig012372g2, partial [Macrostomum lignano]
NSKLPKVNWKILHFLLASMRFKTRIWCLLALFAIAFLVLTYFSLSYHREQSLSINDDSLDAKEPQLADLLNPLPKPKLQGALSNRCTRINQQSVGVKTFFANQLLGKFDRRYDPKAVTFENGVQVPKSLEALKPKGEKLTVFVVPHSHNDPNWLKSYDSYYHLQTRNVLNYALKYLTKWPEMRFIWTEAVFLSTWFSEATPDQRAAMKSLVKQGRLEITSGGWVSPDEASTHYFALINQMLDGHLWIKQNLGVAPETYWNVDPFGYSLLSPHLQSLAGIQNYVILRINEHIKDMLRRERALEFNWQTFWSSSGRGPDTQLLTSVLPFMLYQIKYSCGPNPSFCLYFDFRNIDGELSESLGTNVDPKNVNRLSDMLFQQLEAKSKFYRHNVLMMPLGDDFRWDREEEWNQQYNNYKKLMDYMNSQSSMNVEIKFGTMKDYFTELRAQLAKRPERERLPSFMGDFFTYTDKDEDYWSGYFTSRPGLKRCSREIESLLRAAEIFSTKAALHSADKQLYKQIYPRLDWARRNLSLFQHHDSITGTSTQEVIEEQYLAKVLPGAFNRSVEALAGALASLLGGSIDSPPVFADAFDGGWRKPPRLPGPVGFEIPKQLPGELLIVNSIGQSRYDCLTVVLRGPPASAATVRLLNRPSSPSAADSLRLRCQVEPHFNGISGGISESEFDLLVCLQMPPLSATRVGFSAGPDNSEPTVRCPPARLAMNFPHSSSVWPKIGRLDETAGRSQLTLANSVLAINFTLAGGEPDFVSVQQLGGSDGGVAATGFGLELGYLGLAKSRRGAYIMGGGVEPGAPLSREGLQPDPVVYSVRGPVRSSILRQQNHYRNRVALYSTGLAAVDSAVRVTNLANLPSSESSDMTKRLDLELVMRANFSLANGRYFYTDANSAALVRRHRPVKAPFESGVYPVTGAVVLCGSAGRGGRRRRVAVLTGQSHGAALLPDGRLDIMLHRRTSQDDSRGVGQAMERVYPARSDFLLHWSTQSAADSTDANNNDERLVGDFLTPAELALSRRLNHRPLAFLTRSPGNKSPVVQLSLLPPAGLPCSLEIVTYRLLPPGHRFQALLVLHNQPSVCHKTGNGEQQQQQQPCKAKVGFCLADLFTAGPGEAGPRRPSRAAEATLTGLRLTRPVVDLNEPLPLGGFFFRTFLLQFDGSH